MRAIYLLLYLLFSQITWANERDLMLLGTYENQDVQGWVMSEKLDGVRGYWDGKTLLSRQGLPLPAPTYFTAQFPPFARSKDSLPVPLMRPNQKIQAAQSLSRFLYFLD